MMFSKVCIVFFVGAYARRAPKCTPALSYTTYVPRTPAQSQFVDALSAPETSIIAGIGPAGCGKTMFACMAAVHALESGASNRVIFTRPLIPVDDESLGFFPGSLEAKMEAWTVPFFDAAKEILGAAELSRLRRAGNIEVVPLAYMRGRTFKNAFVVADEMQNSSPMQVFMLATRLGENSKLVLLGDAKQSDRVGVNGLADFAVRAELREWSAEIKAEPSSNIRVVKFGTTDVQRSAIVADIVKMYDNL